MTDRPISDYIRRESGILLHPTSLPAAGGIGDLGVGARDFVDFLAEAGQRLWQLLPLGPIGVGNSPYAAPSAMAGNPLLISLDTLAAEGILDRGDLAARPALPDTRVAYDTVADLKMSLLRRAGDRFSNSAAPAARSEFDAFCQANASWLEDYSLFMAIKQDRGGATWVQWDRPVAMRQPDALAGYRNRLAAEVHFQKFAQFQFHRQWIALRRYTNDRGIRIIGDIPIFVALDSADVWSNPKLFHLAEDGQPTVVAGVPPDYFSRTGQLWGNPLYRWDVMAGEGYRWWVERFRQVLNQVDMVRIDHFRGFQAYWEVPADHKTAEKGRWMAGPGADLFRVVEANLGSLPVIAEDLGLITPEVEALRLELGYPGMKVLQFAFGDDARNPYLPHNYENRAVVYTGTHDNDTTVGWFRSQTAETQARVLRYLGTDGREIHWDLIRLAAASVAEVAVVPLQDVLGLGSADRMNMPGQAGGNWGWRLIPGQLEAKHAERLREMATSYRRWEKKE